MIDEVTASRERFAESLRRCGIRVPDSQSKFLWLPADELHPDVTDALGEAGVSAREFVDEGVRITIGEPEALERVLRVISTLGTQAGDKLGHGSVKSTSAI